MKAIERKIHFYRAHVGADDSGKPLRFEPTKAFAHIDSLPFDTEGRYLTNEDKTFCLWVDKASSFHKLRFSYIRHSGLPQLERAGQLSDLTIPKNSGLAETVHIMTFPNNIVGADFNFYGPRLNRLSSYLQIKVAALLPPVSFEPLIRLDAIDQLNKLEDIRLFQLKVRKSYAERIAQVDAGLGAAFDAAAQVGDTDEVEIILRPRKYSQRSLGKYVFGLVKKLALTESLRTEASKFQVRGRSAETGYSEKVDILSDQLIAKVQVMRVSDRGRALDSQSVYGAIQQAHESLRESLETASSIK